MLDLTVAMMKILLALALIIFQDAPVAIITPQFGETLRGQVNVTGNINVTNFVSAELAFTYTSDLTGTWFTIQTFPAPVLDSALATWDTTMLTDGDYTLRLRVNLQDGSFQEVLVTDLKLRNDIPLPTETSTPAPDAVPTFPPPTSTLAPAPVLPTYPTPTPLPTNSASLTTPSIYSNFRDGALLTLVLFFVVGLSLRLRSK
ncbi:MAG: hypothetical protein HZB19_21310 [Chloroflexi bacterium]|nr:hypothetical protein [Chloroflexota bacterium]